MALTIPEILARTLDDSLAGLYLFQSGRFAFVNKRLADLFGYDVDEVYALGPMDLTHPEDRERVAEIIRQREVGEAEWRQYNFRALRKDGTTFAAQVRGHRVVFDGRPAIAGMLLDITAEQQLEQALRESEQKYKTLVESTIDGISVIVDGKIAFANRAYAEIFGYSTPDELLDRSLTSLLHPDEIARFLAASREFWRGAVEATHGETRGIHRDGTEIEIEIKAKAIQYAGHQAVLSSIRDITQTKRKLMEFEAISEIGQAMNRSTGLPELLSVIHEQVSALMPARNFYVALLDEARQEVSFPYFVDEFDPQPGPRRARRGLTEYVIRNGHTFVWDLDTARVLEEARELEVIGTAPKSWMGVPLRHYERTVGAMVVQSYDRVNAYTENDRQLLEAISSPAAFAIERQMASDALAASAARYRALFETANDAILMLTGTEVIDCNSRALTMFGGERDDIVGHTTVEFSPPIQPDGQQSQRKLELLMSRALAGEALTFGWKGRRRDGVVFDAEVSLNRLVLGGQQFLQAIVHDVSELVSAVEEQNRLRDQLAQVQKMEAVGTLAGGIAHDFNNLLSGILGYTSLAKMQLHEGHPLYRAIDTIEKSASRAAELTNQLLGFARGGRYQVQPTDLNQVVNRVLAIVSRTFDRSITIETALEVELWAVEADSGQLEHSLLNLCLNARDAMPAGGTLHIETKNTSLDAHQAGRLVGLAAGDHIVLAVSDTGIGIDPETEKRIFEPFFTTKDKGKGTGMGLAMVYGIVKNHGGCITVSSELGHGSTFQIYLPASQKKATSHRAATEEEIPRGSGVILLVDDEAIVRDMGSTLLCELGYQVLVAVDGEEACAIYRDHPVDMVILDVVMPGLSGKETFERLRQIDPGARVLVSSGYSIDGQPAELVQSGAMGFIQKPYSLRTLAVAVRDAIGATEGEERPRSSLSHLPTNLSRSQAE